MKRIILLLLPLCILLCGCTSFSAGTDGQDVDNVELIRTVGIDKAEGGVEMTVCSGVGLNGAAPKMYAETAETAAMALNALENGFTLEKAFFSHAEHMVISEAAAGEGLGSYLDFAARVMQMRLDTNLYIVRDGAAKKLLTDTSGEDTAAADMLSSIQREVKNVSEGYVYTCGDVLSSLLADGCALVQAVRLAPSARINNEGEMPGVVPAGYAVIRDGRLYAFIEPELSEGVSIMTKKASGGVTAVSDGNGGKVSLKIRGYDVDFKGIYNDAGAVEGVDVSVRIKTELKQMDKAVEIMNDDVRTELAARLSEKVYEELRGVVDISQSLDLDFLDIGGELYMKNPNKFKNCGWKDGFKNVPINITVSSSIARTYDMIQGFNTKEAKDAG